MPAATSAGAAEAVSCSPPGFSESGETTPRRTPARKRQGAAGGGAAVAPRIACAVEGSDTEMPSVETVGSELLCIFGLIAVLPALDEGPDERGAWGAGALGPASTFAAGPKAVPSRSRTIRASARDCFEGLPA